MTEPCHTGGERRVPPGERRRAVTLIEVLAAVSLMALAAGVAATGLAASVGAGALARAEADVLAIDAAARRLAPIGGPLVFTVVDRGRVLELRRKRDRVLIVERSLPRGIDCAFTTDAGSVVFDRSGRSCDYLVRLADGGGTGWSWRASGTTGWTTPEPPP